MAAAGARPGRIPSCLAWNHLVIAAIAVLPEAIVHRRFVRLEKHLDLIERMLRECSNNC
jgi:hypothetical protein